MTAKFCQHRDRFDNRCNAPTNGDLCDQHQPRAATHWRDAFRPRVYFAFAHVRDGAVVKIGTTIDVPGRLSEINAHSAALVDLLGTVAGGQQVERWLHYHCVRDRSHFEWFRWTERVSDLVSRVLAHGLWAAEAMCPKHLDSDRRGYSSGYGIGPLPHSRGAVDSYLADNAEHAAPLDVCRCERCRRSR